MAIGATTPDDDYVPPMSVAAAKRAKREVGLVLWNAPCALHSKLSAALCSAGWLAGCLTCCALEALSLQGSAFLYV